MGVTENVPCTKRQRQRDSPHAAKCRPTATDPQNRNGDEFLAVVRRNEAAARISGEVW